jgi:UDP-N-acetylmuramoylalanine--D-glutamate ligase
MVLGMGRSGQAAASLILAAGAQPVLADDVVERLHQDSVRRLVEAGAILGGVESLSAVSLVVTSPGVPIRHPVLAGARSRGIPVWGELELAYRRCPAPILAVTGSDGKSTTCSLLAHLIAAAGRSVALAGNIGTPLSAVVHSMDPHGLVVVEVSSYQLETTTSFKPWVAGLLNVAPDHLERHGSLEEYARTKARVFAFQGPDDWAVINADRPGLRDCCPNNKARPLAFSARGTVAGGACVAERWLVQVDRGSVLPVLPVERLAIPGHHNVENALAALAMILPLGIDVSRLAKGLESFRSLPHRLEPIGVARGVRYVNDSKATNVHAAATGLCSVPAPVILLAGGKDKGLSFDMLAEAARPRVRLVITYGEASRRLARALAPVVRTRQAPDLPAAVQEAAALAVAGDTVLLSPACSSFDAYGSFEERGDHFRALVRSLPGFTAVNDVTAVPTMAEGS